MKNFLLIVAALLLPFTSIGTFTVAMYKLLEEGQAGAAYLLFALSALQLVILIGVIAVLHRNYTAVKNKDLQS